MPDFNYMQHQARVTGALKQIVRQQKIPNALLFSGNTGTGKKQAAFSFAKGCNCLSQSELGCSQCRSCIKIESELHPDILGIGLEKDKKAISIAQIRTLISQISSKPNEARFRVIMIRDADRMNIQAQNALLKVLEEPPAQTVFVLLTNDPDALLPTIHSRCRRLRFAPVGEKQIRQFLRAEYSLDDTAAGIAAMTAAGNIEKAVKFSGLGPEKETEDWPGIRSRLLETVSRLITREPASAMGSALCLSDLLNRRPDFLEDAVLMIRSFFRDLMIFKITPEKIVNLDFSDIFKDITRKKPQHALARDAERWLETEKRLASGSASRLTLERFFLQIAQSRGNQNI